jgi:hypothetical protein
MRTRLLTVCFLVFAGRNVAIGDAPRAMGSDAPRRSKIPCPKLRQRLEKSARTLGLEDTKILPNSWGTVPADLQKLPPGAELCGTDSELGDVVIASPLFGKDLQAYYSPLFAKYGCQPLSCNTGSAAAGLADQTRCRCTGPGLAGTLTTDLKTQAFSLTVALAH